MVEESFGMEVGMVVGTLGSQGGETFGSRSAKSGGRLGLEVDSAIFSWG